MKHVIETSEVIGTLDTAAGSCEVCATANAGYDEAKSHLIVGLDAFLRATDGRVRESRLTPPWLPRRETITESVAHDEALDAARDIFHRWVGKVRAAAPPLHQPTF